MKLDKIRKYRGEHADGQHYEPAPNDPPALRRPCSVCPADVGEWCGSLGDVHEERKNAQ
jgi:hypothetical protein